MKRVKLIILISVLVFLVASDLVFLYFYLYQKKLSKQRKEFSLSENQVIDYAWGINEEEVGGRRSVWLYGDIAGKPTCNSKGVCFFKLAIERERSWNFLTLVLGKEDWNIATYQINNSTDEQRNWDNSLVSDLLSSLKKGEPVLAMIPLDDKNIESEIDFGDCDTCRDRYSFLKDQLPGNNRTLDSFKKGNLLMMVPLLNTYHLGPVDSLIY